LAIKFAYQARARDLDLEKLGIDILGMTGSGISSFMNRQAIGGVTSRAPETNQPDFDKNFSSGKMEYFISGQISGTVVEALPDTGADVCFMSPDLASRLKLLPKAETRKEISLASGKLVKSPGVVEVPWNFTNETKAFPLSCWILPGCVHDLILGSQFLKATETLKKHSSRIKNRLAAYATKLRLCSLDAKRQRLYGHLNGHLTRALPDTGSDLMLISSAYAREIGLQVERNFENRREIEFAEGSTAWTEGVVRNVSWNVGGNTVNCDFHVLEELYADVILSKEYLFGFDVFLEYSKWFFDVDLEEDISHLCNIRLIGGYSDVLGQLEEDYLEDSEFD
jgi:predicted aspartyl protease